MRLPDVDLATGGMGALPPWRPATAANLRCWSRELATKRQRKAIARPVDGFNVVWSTARPPEASSGRRTDGAQQTTMPSQVAVLVPLQLILISENPLQPLKPLLHLL
jgi:hypothetical protein